MPDWNYWTELRWRFAPLRACAAMVTVCVSTLIMALQATRRPVSDNQRLQNYASLKTKKAIFLKRLRSRDMSWKQLVCIIALADLDLMRSLRVPLKHKKSKRRACIDSRMLSTSVAGSPCQTLRELLAWRPHTHSPAHALFAEGFTWLIFCCLFFSYRL